MSFVAVAIGGSAILGFVASENASDAASEASANQVASADRAAQLQYDLGKDTLDFQKQYFNDFLKPTTERDLAMRESLLGALIPSITQQTQFAGEQIARYKNTYIPVEDQMVRDAMGYDSEANIDRRMGIAAANVNQQFSNAAGQNARMLSRYGINPNSSAFAQANAKLANNQALASAGAQTGAAFDTMDRAIALRAGAANFGRNMPNTAAQFGQVANQGAGVAGNIGAQGVQNAVSAVGPMLDGSRIASSAYNSAGGIANNAFSNQMQMYNSQMNGIGGFFQGVGNFAGRTNAFSGFGDRWSNFFSPSFTPAATNAFTLGIDQSGMYADGGLVDGPGGPRDDMIPAMLSKNEFVLNEGAVKHFGLAKLNKMNEVGLQNQEARGLIRRA